MASKGYVLVDSTTGLADTTMVSPEKFEVVYQAPLNTALVDTPIFVASAACQMTAATELHGVNSALAANVQITKDTGTTAPGGGIILLTNNTNAGFDLNAAANTVQTGTLTATEASLQLAIGDRLSLKFSGTLTGAVKTVVTVAIKYI